jgi:hypothetical protein
MANVTKMQDEFNKLFKKYDSASYVREMDNANRGVQLSLNLQARKEELHGFRTRFDTAFGASDTTAMQTQFNNLMKKYESASYVREMDNAARGVQLSFSLKARKEEIQGFKDRFQAAVDEVVAP